MIIPVASVGAAFVDLAIGFALLIPLAIYYGTRPSVNLLLLPILTALTGLMAVGVGLGMASLSVKYRDVRHALPFVLQILLFVTPVIFPSSFIPEEWRWMLMINPLSSLVEGFRSAILGTPVDFLGLAIATTLVVVILLLSVSNFRRMERGFADLV
jgi:lipopolysaccharide transport system permease protein